MRKFILPVISGILLVGLTVMSLLFIKASNNYDKLLSDNISQIEKNIKLQTDLRISDVDKKIAQGAMLDMALIADKLDSIIESVENAKVYTARALVSLDNFDVQGTSYNLGIAQKYDDEYKQLYQEYIQMSDNFDAKWLNNDIQGL